MEMNVGFDHVVAHTSFLGNTGYNYHSRGFFTALNKLMKVRVRNYSYGDDPFSYLTEEQNEMLILSRLSSGVVVGVPYDAKNVTSSRILNIVLNETNHYYFYDSYEGRKIAYNVWESTRQPEEFFNKLLEYDQLWVPTEWQKRVTIEQGYPEDRIHIVHEAVEPEFHPLPMEKRSNDVFRFLVFGRWDYRKSTLELVQAFVDLYGNREGFELVLDTDNPFATDGLKSTEERLKYYHLDDIKNIKVLHYPNRRDYIDILQNGSAFLSCARAEGWNIPLMHAMACGIPVIYSNYGGQLEFTKGACTPIPVAIAEMLPADQVYNVPNCPGDYCEPDFNDLRFAMTEVVSNYDAYLLSAREYSKELREEFTWENAAKAAYGALKSMEYPELGTLNGRPGDPDYTYGEIFVDRVYELKDCRVKPGDIVVDLGANVGLFSMYAAKSGASHVYAFEPIHETYEYLTSNVRSTNLDTIVSCYNFAVVGKLHTGFDKLKMHIGKSSVGAHVMGNEEEADTVEVVHATTLNTILEKLPYIDFMKVDIEHSEYEMFKNTDLDLLANKIDRIVIELHGDDWYDKIRDFAREMKSRGFSIRYKSPNNTANEIQIIPDSTYGMQYMYLEKDSEFDTIVLYRDDKPKVLFGLTKNVSDAKRGVKVTLSATTYDGDVVSYSDDFTVELGGSYWITANVKYSELKDLRLFIRSRDDDRLIFDQYLHLGTTPISLEESDFALTTDKEDKAITQVNGRKIFVLGLPKAGTSSLQKAFEESSIPSAHWEVPTKDGKEFVGVLIARGLLDSSDPWYYLQEYRAITQADVCLPEQSLNIWPQLNLSFLDRVRKLYPDCMFILNFVEAGDVAESIMAWGDLHERIVKSDLPGLPIGFGEYKQDLVDWINDHYARIRRYFKVFNEDASFVEIDIKNDDVRKKLSEALGEEIKWWGKANENITTSFIHGPKVEIAKHVNSSKYKIEFIDDDIDATVFSVKDAKDGTFAQASREYYTKWLVRVSNPTTGKVYKEVRFDPTDQRVFIVLDSKAIGDTVAWMPYVEKFREVHNCKVVCSTFHRRFFEEVYPKIDFVNPGATVDNIYAQFNIGAFDNDYNKNRNNWRSIPLQQVASDTLGLPYEVIRPTVDLPIYNGNAIDVFKKPYVTLSEHSTFQMMYWNNPRGWVEVVSYLNSNGYGVVNVSKEGSKIPGVINPKSYDMDYTLNIINNAEFHMGVSTGGCWLAWALGKEVIMVSGCTPAKMEFPCHRVIDTDVCNSCFGDFTIPIDRGNWNWCPRGKNFECTRKIESPSVISIVEELIGRGSRS